MMKNEPNLILKLGTFDDYKTLLESRLCGKVNKRKLQEFYDSNMSYSFDIMAQLQINNIRFPRKDQRACAWQAERNGNPDAAYPKTDLNNPYVQEAYRLDEIFSNFLDSLLDKFPNNKYEKLKKKLKELETEQKYRNIPPEEYKKRLDKIYEDY